MPDEIESLDEPTPEAAKLRRFDLRALWRVTFWGCSAALAVVVVAGTAFSDFGAERVKEAIASVIEQAKPVVAQVEQADVQRAEIEKQAQQLAEQLRQQGQQTERLRETLKQFAAERDQLKNRIALLEQGFEDITGAIKRQTEKAAQQQTAQQPAAPTTPPPTVSAPQTVTVAVAAPPKVSSSEPAQVPTPPARTAALPPLPGVTQPTDAKREFGVDLGGAATLEQVRTAWSTIKANLGPELVGMRPAYTQRTKSSGAVEYRLVLVGSVTDNTEAIAFCSKLATMKLTCRAGHFRVSQLAER
jgi:TolA-binding protein